MDETLYSFHDEELIYLYRRGNDWAFEMLLEKYIPIIKHEILNQPIISMNAHYELDEILQLCYLCLNDCIANYCDTSNARFQTFFMNRLRFHVIDCVRNGQRLDNKFGTANLDDIEYLQPSKSSVDITMKFLDLIDYANNELEGIEKQILLELIAGKTQKQIMHTLNISLRQYDNALYRVRKKIRFLQQ